MNKIIPTLALVAGFSLNVSAATVDLIEGVPPTGTPINGGESITNNQGTVNDPGLISPTQVPTSGPVAVANGSGPDGEESWYLDVSGGVVTTTVQFTASGIAGIIAPDIAIYATKEVGGVALQTGSALAEITGTNGQITPLSVSAFLSANNPSNPYIIDVSGPASSYTINVATPIPAATWLFGSAFVGLMTYYRRKVGAFGSFNGLAA